MGKGRSLTSIALCALLCACATPEPSWSLFHPGPDLDPVQFVKDREWCQEQAKAYISRPSLSDIGVKTINGGLGAVSALNPWGVAAGGGAGFISSLLSWAGLSVEDERAVFIECIKQKTTIDRSAVILDPH